MSDSMSRDHSLPLGRGESIWIAVAAAVTVMTVLMLLAGPNLQNIVTRPVSPSPPVHSALPDLCAVFPGGAAGGLTLRPDPSSRVLDRSDAGCSYTVAGSDRETSGSVRIAATRPEPTGLNPDRAGELKAARRAFRERYVPSPGSDPFHPLPGPGPGPGDEAQYATTAREYGTATTVVIRDGVLLVEVRYDVSELGAAKPRTSTATVQDTARRIAVELLARLPREGA